MTMIQKIMMLVMFSILTSIGGTAFAYTGFSALVIEPKTGKVIYEHNATERRYPASLTKIMTLYILFEDLSKGKIKMNQRMPISQRAVKAECSCLRPKAGTSITVETAVKALIVQSANDVSIAVAEFIGGTEAKFVERMNKTAKRLGMTNTHFVNPNGLPNDNQYTTARDMATLGVAIYNHFPKYYPLFQTESFYFDGRLIKGHNRVNSMLAGADGIKTGYIRKSGSNLVTSAQRGNTRLFGVVIGGRNTQSRDNIMVDIMEQSFEALQRNHRNPSISPIITEDLLVGYDPQKNPKPKQIVATNHKNKVNIVSHDAPQTIPTIKLISNHKTIASTTNSKKAAAIQVGAYKSRKSAQDRARMAHRKLQQGKIDVVLIDNLYRARLSGFSYEKATLACHQLKQSGNDCIVIAK
ncbi:D-alanyl-D-alanine carboxypeptidase [Wohlfahrtiimonas chitiniclastica]|uniref:D-alanyl-D-alanine carboxypeptidase n=1 Tax=Wohlfahrtiimonas chitiniclastica TaxID=400946 RepID=UPI001FEFDB32|nr:D-alanyl-D-alanine carboxypeptidase [Wohlfahrtiimonas chitiniclastica]